jgi:hypothetical protein
MSILPYCSKINQSELVINATSIMISAGSNMLQQDMTAYLHNGSMGFCSFCNGAAKV